MEKFDYSVFNHPRIFFAEKLVPHGQTIFFEQNELKTSRDFLIDYIWFGEDSIRGDVSAPNASLIGSLFTNWQIVDRAPVWPVDEFAVTTLQNFWDADRSWDPSAANKYCQLAWRHAIRWIYNPTQDVRFDWEVPLTNIVRPQLTIYPSMVGTSLKTGHRRVYGLANGIVYPSSVASPAASGTASEPNAAGNLGDDPYAMEGFEFWTSAEWQGQDLRWLNNLKLKAIPSQGEAWSDVPIPLAVYALHQSVVGRWVTYKPTGGPLLLKAGQSFVAKMHNVSGNDDTYAQIALIGRTAPGIGSVGLTG